MNVTESCPKKDKWIFRAIRPIPAFRGVQGTPEERSGLEDGFPARQMAFYKFVVSPKAEWALFCVCVGLDALVLYALMAAAERWAR